MFVNVGEVLSAQATRSKNTVTEKCLVSFCGTEQACDNTSLVEQSFSRELLLLPFYT